MDSRGKHQSSAYHQQQQQQQQQRRRKLYNRQYRSNGIELDSNNNDDDGNGDGDGDGGSWHMLLVSMLPIIITYLAGSSYGLDILVFALTAYVSFYVATQPETVYVKIVEKRLAAIASFDDKDAAAVAAVETNNNDNDGDNNKKDNKSWRYEVELKQLKSLERRFLFLMLLSPFWGALVIYTMKLVSNDVVMKNFNPYFFAIIASVRPLRRLIWAGKAEYSSLVRTIGRRRFGNVTAKDMSYIRSEVENIRLSLADLTETSALARRTTKLHHNSLFTIMKRLDGMEQKIETEDTRQLRFGLYPPQNVTMSSLLFSRSSLRSKTTSVVVLCFHRLFSLFGFSVLPSSWVEATTSPLDSSTPKSRDVSSQVLTENSSPLSSRRSMLDRPTGVAAHRSNIVSDIELDKLSYRVLAEESGPSVVPAS